MRLLLEPAMPVLKKKDIPLEQRIKGVVDQTPILDIHTHIYDANFGELLLWGIDEILTYHYLIAEVFRVAPMPYETFFAMTKRKQADYIWQNLFIDRSPVSEACRGILTCLYELGLDTSDRKLNNYRAFFKEMTVDDYIDLVFKTAKVRGVIMTNNPFDDLEYPVWQKKIKRDRRFRAALRIDDLFINWPEACKKLASWGYDVEPGLGEWTLSEIRRFLEDWIKKMKPAYMAASLGTPYIYPDDSPATRIIDNCIMPVGREHNLPFAVMIGVKRLMNPGLGLAGDSVGKSPIESVERLCADYPDNKFMATMLSRENQHELCITARKFPNLLIFGCWWFLNNPSIIDEMTRERLELLGLSMIPQHSDARVLDQLLYKWSHSRKVIGSVLVDKYSDLEATGWKVSDSELKRDVKALFGGVLEDFLKR